MTEGSSEFESTTGERKSVSIPQSSRASRSRGRKRREPDPTDLLLGLNNWAGGHRKNESGLIGCEQDSSDERRGGGKIRRTAMTMLLDESAAKRSAGRLR